MFLGGKGALKFSSTSYEMYDKVQLSSSLVWYKSFDRLGGRDRGIATEYGSTTKTDNILFRKGSFLGRGASTAYPP